MKIKHKITFSVLAIIVVALLGIIIYGNTGIYQPASEAVMAMNSGQDIIVEDVEKEYIAFYPKNYEVTTGLIFYPGGKVEAEAYANVAREIAEKGYLVTIAYMPMDLAVFDKNKAKEIINSFSNIETWVIGGHSLGGVMASSYAVGDERIKGLLLYASYPSGNELAHKDITVMSIWGSEDKVADIEKIKGAKENLPEKTRFIEIEGGNHGGFGDYGKQKGDGDATISKDQQIKLVVQYSVELLKEVK